MNQAAHSERRITTLWAVIIAIVLAAVGVSLLYIAGLDMDYWTANPGLRALLMQLGSLLIVGLALAFLWELFGRRIFLQEMLAVAQIAQDLRGAGLLRVVQSPNQIDWSPLIDGATCIDIFFTYGRSWRGHFYQQLQAVAERPNTVMRIILPDPDDKLLMKSLGVRFKKPPTDQANDIRDAYQFFARIAQKAQDPNQVQVWYTTAAPVVSLYRFDGTAVVALYPHKAKIDLPHFVCRRGGSLYSYAMDQLTILTSPTEGISRRAL